MKRLVILAIVPYIFLVANSIAQENMVVNQAPSAKIGLGARMQGNVPLALGELRLGNMGIGAEVGFASGTVGMTDLASASISILVAGASGRLLFLFEKLPVAPYVGANVMLLMSTVTMSLLGESATGTASTVGLGAFGGVELALSRLPIALFVDLRFLSFRDFTLEVDGESISVPISISGLSVSIGGRLDLRF